MTVALWYDSLNMFCKCIGTAADCLSENMGSGEEVYRTAVLLMAEVWEKEFYHCLGLVKELAGLSGIEKEEKVLEMLEAYEVFFAL